MAKQFRLHGILLIGAGRRSDGTTDALFTLQHSLAAATRADQPGSSTVQPVVSTIKAGPWIPSPKAS